MSMINVVAIITVSNNNHVCVPIDFQVHFFPLISFTILKYETKNI